jgi:S-adenosylmethionine decarboxylase
MTKREPKLKLYGFNNLTKTLSFNIYDVCYARSEPERQRYLSYIDERYNSDRLTKILFDVSDTIGAHVLNVSKQDYDPRGASVNILVTEEPVPEACIDASCNRGLSVGVVPKHSIAGHLDKSHLTVHTYPESHPDNAVATFRVDIDVSTCGQISPLKALNDLIGSFDSDIITIDYRVRGFTREENGRKIFLDHPMMSIQDFIDRETLRLYDAMDVNIYQSNLFHTKMLIKEIRLENYLFDTNVLAVPPEHRPSIIEELRREMIEIFSGMNLS